ncbi:MAG: hypothetical protein E4H00_03555 [Myxococcales bacterium]|nr:MAG: hypothetical protein E4H00_03555 [Myxococcales bacterium]
MTRSTLLTLVCAALLTASCSSSANQTSPDGGTREPDGGTPDGGVPAPIAPCEIDGYPCAPGYQSASALQLSEEYKGAIQERRVNGESYLEIAGWLRDEDSVVDVVAAADRIRFRVEGGSAHWLYAISPEHPSATLPAFEETSGARPSLASMDSGLALKSVLRDDSSQTKIKKKGLILEPFRFQFLSNTSQWKARLERLHDYDAVQYFSDRDIPDSYFGNWNDYRFVWVLSHGAYLPDEADPLYTGIFSSKECGMYLWLATDVGAGELGRDGTTKIATLMGLPRSVVEPQLTPEQQERWRSFRDAELEDLKQDGQSCGVLEMPDAALPVTDAGGQPIVRAPAFLDYIYYDEAWFLTNYSGGLDNVLLYLSICSSQTVPIPGTASAPNSRFGWSEPMESEEDNLASDVLFERLIEFGDTVEDAFKNVTDADLHTHQFEGKQTELSHTSLGGADRARIREIISIIDPNGLVPFDDEGGMLEAREITSQGQTVVDVTVEIVGFGEREAKEFKVQIFDRGGGAISAEFEVDDPILGETIMTIPISLNQEIRSPTDVEIEARVTLPEETGTVHSKHPITLTIGPAIESAWTLNVGGAGTARGEFVFAPFPMGIVDDEGRLIWQVTLGQIEDFGVPMATVLIVGHNGRTAECNGQTGTFEAVVAPIYNTDPMPTEGYGGGLGAGKCGDFVNVEIVSFSRKDDLVANISGTICHWRRVGEEVVATPVPINGRFQMPAAGCGMVVGGDLIGSYRASEQPSLCIDIYPNAAIGPVFDEVCAGGGGLICSEEPCSTAGQIGQCDYRSEATTITFRGQIQHFGQGGDWPPVGDLQGACEVQLGAWTTGEPIP